MVNKFLRQVAGGIALAAVSVFFLSPDGFFTHGLLAV